MRKDFIKIALFGASFLTAIASATTVPNSIPALTDVKHLAAPHASTPTNLITAPAHTVPANPTTAPSANATSATVATVAAQPTFTPTTTQAAASTPATPTPQVVTNKTADNNATDSRITKNHGLLSFNFQNVSTRTLLQLIAQNANLNFVISDSVKGNMSLSLQNVTWKKALDVVLQANGLDKRTFDNVFIIAPIEELASNDSKRMQAQQQLQTLMPPVSAIIPLKYANATELAGVIKGQQSSLLSPNGQMGTDPRTNSIWLRDTPTNLDKVRQFIKQLDIPAKQVLIEARIVTVDTQYAKELGVRWGVSNMRNLSGTLKGANDIRSGTPLSSVDVAERLNFNVPAGNVFGAPAASMGLALLRIGKGYLDLELSALEGEQRGQIISNPRVITSNLKTATIQTGEEIPYQEATSSGATSISFKKAVLSLEITPQITVDNHIVLNLKVTQNKRGTNTNTGSTEVPAIDTQEVQSFVFLNNDETIVIGGVYKQTKQNTVERVPFFGSLPIIGGLFRHTSVDNKREELLIFITPKIVEQGKASVMTAKEKKLNQLGLSINEDKGVDYEKAD